MCSTFRFTDNFVDDAEILQVFSRELHCFGCGFCFCRVAPHDGSTSFRSNHGIKAVFQDVDAIPYGNGKRSAGTAFSRNRHNDWNGQPCHFPQVPGYCFSLPALFRINARICARRIDERQNRARKFRGQLHDTKCLPVAFRLRLAKIPEHSLFCVAPFLVADHGNRASVELSESRDDCLVVPIASVTVQLDKVGEQELGKVLQIRTLLMAGNLSSLPRAEMRVEFATEFGYFSAYTLKF